MAPGIRYTGNRDKGFKGRDDLSMNFQGASMLAIKYLLNRFSYSLVWCNLLNCIGIQDDVLGSQLRLELGKIKEEKIN